MFTMLVSIEVLPEFITSFIEITRYNVFESRKEPGIIRFDFYQDRDNPSAFKLLEVYREEEDRAEHQKTAHFNTWKQTVAPWMASERTRQFLIDLTPATPE